MIAVIRISGLVKIRENISETLDRLGLKKKYVCVILDERKKEEIGMVNKVRNFIAYGTIDQETLAKLILARAKKIDKTEIKKQESEILSKEIMNGKRLKDFGIKNYFRLHPPRKGINSKLPYPKGVLGNHKNEIKELLMRML